jgi:probable HAF family extracellular repeat protein
LAADCLYDITVIQGPADPIVGPPVTIPLGLNNAGHVVGYWSPIASESMRAFLWTPEAGFTTLPMPPGTRRSVANDISDAGHICGWYDQVPDGLNELGFLYHDGSFVSLGTMPGGNFSEALAVNIAGQVVGCWGNNNTGPMQAFLWQGQMFDLGPALGTPNGCANDISERGVVVGWMGQADHLDARAFLLDNDKVRDLGAMPGGYTSVAMAVSEAGDVVGWGSVFDPDCPVPAWHTFLYTEGQMLDLGILPDHRRTLGMGVNESQQVTGTFAHYPGCSDPGAFIWQGGVMVDVEGLISPATGITIGAAWAINSAGQIAASGGVGGEPAALLLTPPKRPAGDIDGDCEVGIPDIELLFVAWGACAGCAADLNFDQVVNVVDFLLLLSNWG